ncbi:MAG: alpha-glucosidase/alpha-galactosidase [Armatimonadetes bacterium]|nr:alpha-glucosidase/alpha-galactosidase [Armatimonadota bacterium]
MAKIVIIGAGSGFGGRLSIDILSCEALRDAQICLCDLHEGRLEQVRAYVQRTIDRYNLPATVCASTDRRDLLPDADFVITSISVGGGAYYGFPYTAEVRIPQKYGIDQAVADTVSVGAVFRFLRTGPVQHQIVRDMEQLCPGAILLNHTNPMAMLSWLHCADSSIQYVGLCHGIQGTTQMLANWLGIPYKEISYSCAGINHLSWIMDFQHHGQDLYPRLFEFIDDPEKRKHEGCRLDIMKHFGRFCTESNHHDSEYLPYFRRTPELMAHYGFKAREVADEFRGKREWMADGAGEQGAEPVGELRRSGEYTSGIIEGVVTDTPYRFYGNVLNHGSLINNLPANCCVEVLTIADAGGIHAMHYGDLPPHLAALCRSNVAVQELAVKAVLERDKEAAFHACCLDPNAAAIVPLDGIREMFEELWTALDQGGLLNWFDRTYTGALPETCAT